MARQHSGKILKADSVPFNRLKKEVSSDTNNPQDFASIAEIIKCYEYAGMIILTEPQNLRNTNINFPINFKPKDGQRFILSGQSDPIQNGIYFFEDPNHDGVGDLIKILEPDDKITQLKNDLETLIEQTKKDLEKEIENVPKLTAGQGLEIENNEIKLLIHPDSQDVIEIVEDPLDGKFKLKFKADSIQAHKIELTTFDIDRTEIVSEIGFTDKARLKIKGYGITQDAYITCETKAGLSLQEDMFFVDNAHSETGFTNGYKRYKENNLDVLECYIIFNQKIPQGFKKYITLHVHAQNAYDFIHFDMSIRKLQIKSVLDNTTLPYSELNYICKGRSTNYEIEYTKYPSISGLGLNFQDGTVDNIVQNGLSGGNMIANATTNKVTEEYNLSLTFYSVFGGNCTKTLNLGRAGDYIEKDITYTADWDIIGYHEIQEKPKGNFLVHTANHHTASILGIGFDPNTSNWRDALSNLATNPPPISISIVNDDEVRFYFLDSEEKVQIAPINDIRLVSNNYSLRCIRNGVEEYNYLNTDLRENIISISQHKKADGTFWGINPTFFKIAGDF